MFSDLTGWVYSLEAETGKLRWKKKVEEHEATRLTGGALIHDGIAYIPASSWEETRALNPDYRVLHVSRQHHRACAFAMGRSCGRAT